MNRKRGSLARRVGEGIIMGAAGGLVAAYAMNQFQSRVSQMVAPAGGGEPESGPAEGDDATIKAASAVSASVFRHELTHEEKQAAGPAMHYAFGATMGAVYGGLSAAVPVVSAGFGVPFGAALWLGADEIAVPALGFSKPPTDYPSSTHVAALGAHLVFGFVLDLTRRAFRDAW